jgi:hypothetical protein
MSRRLIVLLCVFSFSVIHISFSEHLNKRISSVNGGGVAVEFGVKSTFTFNAVKHANGSVNGHLVYNLRAFDMQFQLAIDCFEIDGNRATLSGTVMSVSGDDVPAYIYPGIRASFSVQDNGKGGNKDRISDVVFGAQCGDDLDTYLPVQGNITVRE